MKLIIPVGSREALRFEVNLESNLIKLYNDILTDNYFVGPSTAFIVEKPVKRDIFAGSFRDRIVHHLIINKTNHLFEKEFIYDSYSCRVGKGTHFGIRRVDRFIRKCSVNYSEDCYVLKMDVKAFFMSINKTLLYSGLESFFRDKYKENDLDLLLKLCKLIIFNNPVKNCSLVGDKGLWKGLPKDKSLFYSGSDCGLPIGNLTSQIFANFYLNVFDHFIKSTLDIKYYGRYVDDFVIVHRDKKYLNSLIVVIRNYMLEKLGLTLHPNKIYLQHYSKGVKFLGTVIKPYRIYIANRTKGNFYNSIILFNRVVSDHKPTRDEILGFQCCMNSYLGIMKHYQSYNTRFYMLGLLSYNWKKRFSVTLGLTKLSLLNAFIYK